MTAIAEVDVPRGTSVPLDARIHRLPLEFITFASNVRVVMAGIDELAASIAEQGVLQPIKVRHAADGAGYIVTWGHRRVIASRQAGLTDIPAFIDDTEQTPEERAIEQLIENMHREDLNPIDRATALRAVVAAGMTQAELARKLGLAPSTIANDLGLLEAPAKILEAVQAGDLTAAHAKALKGLAAKTQLEIAKEAIDQGWSAHDLEEEVQNRRQQADAIRERNEQDAKQRELQKVEIAASITDGFPKKKVAKDARIVVGASDSYYGQGTAKSESLAKLIAAAGYTNVTVAKRYGDIRPRPTGGVCDCNVWKAAEFERGSYEGNRYVRHVSVSISKGCVERNHEVAKLDNDEKARRAKVATQEKVQTHVKANAIGLAHPMVVGGNRQTGGGHIEPGITVQRILAEAALFSLLSYNLPTWSEAHGGNRTNPWQTLHALADDDLATELAKAIAGDFRDHAGYHVDWSTLAVELGIETPVATANPIADGPRATTLALEVTAAAPAGARQLNLKDPVLIGDRPLKVLSITYPKEATRQSARVSLRPIDLGKDIEVAIDRLAWDRKAKGWRVDPETLA